MEGKTRRMCLSMRIVLKASSWVSPGIPSMMLDQNCRGLLALGFQFVADAVDQVDGKSRCFLGAFLVEQPEDAGSLPDSKPMEMARQSRSL
jgi:hypothetical protein